MRGRLPVWLGALALVLAAVALRAPSLPRETWNLDEANTAVFAQHVLQGELPYRDFVDTRSPLMVYLLAAEARVVGDWNLAGLHVALALMLGLAAVLLWRTVVRLGGGAAGAWAAAVFTLAQVLLVDPIDAFTTHTEWFVVFLSALGFWLLAHAWRASRPLLAALAGVSFGLGYLAKQPGLLDGAAAAAWIGLFLAFDPAARRARWSLLAALAAGWCATAAAAPLYFWSQGALREYQFYVWTYSTRYYLPEVPAGEHWKALASPLLLAGQHLPAFALAAGVAVVLLLRGLARSLPHRLAGQEVPLLALGWTAAGIVASALGGRAFDHYSIQAIPGLSLLAGWTLSLAWARGRTAAHRAPALLWRGLAVAPFLLGAAWAARRLSSLDLDPGPAKPVGEIVRACTEPSDRIFVWGFYPEVGYYARRLNASRFASANFLTGLIPWTNLDPDRDTAYAVVPGAWDEFWTDLERHPPAVFVDSNVYRGYGKYPLARQPRLWAYLQSHYVEIEADQTHPRGFRLYRRTGEPLAGAAPAGSDAALALQPEFAGTGLASTLHARLPPGLTAAELLVNGRSLGSVPLAPDRRHQLTFSYRPAIHGPNPVITVQARRRDGTLAAGPAHRIGDVPPQPVVTCGPVELPALESECLTGPLAWLPQDRVYSAHAPARLVFARPKVLRGVSFDFGLFDGAFAPERRPPSDGVELQVTLVPDDGPPQRLFSRRIDPLHVPADRGRQQVKVDLPPGPAGRLVIALTTGPASDGSSDWAYLGPITGAAMPLTLAHGGRHLLAADFDAPLGVGEIMEDSRLMVLAHAPATVEFQLEPDMRVVSGEFALARSSWENPAGHTAGIDFMAEHVGPDGRVTKLWRQRLEPGRVVADRGLHSFRFSLPTPATGRLRLRSAAAHPPDNSYGYSCWANLLVK